jgi:hypothetical protein
MVHVPDRKRQKLDPKSTLGTFVGYALNRSGYRIWDGEKCAVVESRDVQFLNEETQDWTYNSGTGGSLQTSSRNEEGVANPPRTEDFTVGLDLELEVTGRSYKHRSIRVDGKRSQQKSVRFTVPDTDQDSEDEDQPDRNLMLE